MRTTTERPVRSLTARTRVQKGGERWAAVMALALKVSPLAVRRPWKPGPYQEAGPCWTPAAWASKAIEKAQAARAAENGSLKIFIIPHPFLGSLRRAYL